MDCTNVSKTLLPLILFHSKIRKQIFFCAGANTQYHESLINGLPCLRYTDGSFDLEYGLDDVFEDETSFSMLLNTLKNSDIDEYRQKVNTLLEYTLGLGIDNHI